MVAGLTAGKKKYAAVDVEMRDIAQSAAALGNELSALVKRDADAYASVSEAYKLPKEPANAAARRSEAVTKALLGAAEVPIETATASVEVAKLALAVAERGNSNAVTDAGVAALLAEAAAKGAGYNTRVNVQALDDRSKGASLLRRAEELVKQASALAHQTAEAVERALS
jgi:glutamate formiminotransferase/formiminotetrahydrofolate cyclodeaminase